MPLSQGKLIENLIIDRAFLCGEQDKQVSWQQLKILLKNRLENLEAIGISQRTVQEITTSALYKAGVTELPLTASENTDNPHTD